MSVIVSPITKDQCIALIDSWAKKMVSSCCFSSWSRASWVRPGVVTINSLRFQLPESSALGMGKPASCRSYAAMAWREMCWATAWARTAAVSCSSGTVQSLPRASRGFPCHRWSKQNHLCLSPFLSFPSTVLVSILMDDSVGGDIFFLPV